MFALFCDAVITVIYIINFCCYILPLEYCDVTTSVADNADSGDCHMCTEMKLHMLPVITWCTFVSFRLSGQK